MEGSVCFTLTMANGVICPPLATVFQYIFDYVGWDLDANIDVLLRLPFLHCLFDVSDNLFKLAWQRLLVNPSLIRPAMGSLFAVFSSTTILLVDSGPKTSFGGSLEPLNLCCAFSLLLTFRCYRITSNFLVNKLHAEGYLPSYAEQVIQTF